MEKIKLPLGNLTHLPSDRPRAPLLSLCRGQQEREHGHLGLCWKRDACNVAAQLFCPAPCVTGTACPCLGVLTGSICRHAHTGTWPALLSIVGRWGGVWDLIHRCGDPVRGVKGSTRANLPDPPSSLEASIAVNWGLQQVEHLWSELLCH